MGIAEGNPCVKHRFVIAEIENQLSILRRVLERKNERKKEKNPKRPCAGTSPEDMLVRGWIC